MAEYPSLKNALETAIAGTIRREKEYDKSLIRPPTERDYLLRAFQALIEAYLSRIGGFGEPIEREWHGTQRTFSTSN